MKASVKCSSCGAEISNLQFTWGKKYWLCTLIPLPIMLIALFPMWRMLGPRGDYREDLQITVQEKRTTDDNLKILGSIENQGKTTWDGVELDAEFYDADGKFIDEESSRVSSSIVPGQTEHFKIEIYSAPARILDDNVQMKLKIAGAHSRMF